MGVEHLADRTSLWLVNGKIRSERSIEDLEGLSLQPDVEDKVDRSIMVILGISWSKEIENGSGKSKED